MTISSIFTWTSTGIQANINIQKRLTEYSVATVLRTHSPMKELLSV